MLATVRTYINRHQLLAGDRPVIVGLSGGADSVALLAVLTQLGYHCMAAHCNFHLRGHESDSDEAFARALALRLDVPFFKTDFDTLQYASGRHVSVEMAARELRYRWFDELCHQEDAQAIAVAHHRDDNVETVLMNLIRGTGIRGLRGIRPRNGRIVRPFLEVSRADILAWLRGQELDYVTDSSNLSDAYTRNYIRLHVLPLLEKLNPSVKEAVARTAGQLSAVEAVYLAVADKAVAMVMEDHNRLSIPALLRFPSPETILYELLLPFHFSRQATEDIFRALDKESGKIFYSPTHRLVKDRNCLLLSPLETPPPFQYLIPEPEGEASYGAFTFSFRRLIADESFELRKDKHTAYFNYDKLSFPLTLRTWQPGDWFVPFGMKGRKKLSDFFSDLKYSRLDKEKALLLCSGDHIIWVVGERTDERYRIEKSTKNILFINFSCNM